MVHHNSIFPAQTNNILNDNCHPNPVVSPYGLTQSLFKLHSLKPFVFVLNPAGLALVHMVFGWGKKGANYPAYVVLLDSLSSVSETNYSVL